MFAVVGGLFAYTPTFIAYHRRLLEELYEDNVMYVELRMGLPSVSESIIDFYLLN